MVYEFLDKKSAGADTSGSVLQSKTMLNQQLPEVLQKSITRKLITRKIYSFFSAKNWGANFADMQLISKYNKGTRLLPCVIDIYSKHDRIVPLKHKKVLLLLTLFRKLSINLDATQT